jgi:DNA-binding GntR family transcriptional regulator
MEGLVRIDAHRTVTTAPLTGRELNELYIIRTELDSLAAGLAAAAATDDELLVIAELARQEIVTDPVVQLERNRSFHRAVYTASHNESLVALLDQLWDRTDRYRLILVREELVERPAPQQEHIDIADAIVARHAEAAVRLTRDHIARSRIRIARALSLTEPAGMRSPGKEPSSGNSR